MLSYHDDPGEPGRGSELELVDDLDSEPGGHEGDVGRTTSIASGQTSTYGANGVFKALWGRAKTTRMRSSVWSRASEASKLARNFSRPVFPDAEAMKEKVRQAILMPEDKPADFYHETGCCQALARNACFEILTLFVIIINSMWLAIEVSFNDKDLLYQADPGFQVVENLFCAFFTFEWGVRFGSFRDKRHALVDKWLLFDTFLVTGMVLETWVFTFMFAATSTSMDTSLPVNTSILRGVRLLRLTRVARVARLFRAYPEAMLIIRSLIIVCRTVFLIVFVLSLVVYCFAIMLTQMSKGTRLEGDYFTNVPKAMYKLTLGAIFPDMAVMADDLGTESWFFAMLFLLFTVLAETLFMNLLIGALVEVVGAVASAEREQSQVNAVKEQLAAILRDLDRDSDGTLDKSELYQIINDVKATKGLMKIGVDAVGLIDSADALYKQKETLDVKEVLELLLELRGSNPTKVKDLVYLRRYLTTYLKRLEIKFDQQFGIERNTRILSPEYTRSFGPT